MGTDLAMTLARRHFAVDGADLVVEGHRVRDLAHHYGTPLYIYSGAVMRTAYRRLAAALAGFAAIHFSVKANPDRGIIGVFLSEGAGVEIASVGEYRRARAAGAAPERIVFAGPAKRPAELQAVLAAGIGEIHVETVEELDRLEAIGQALEKQVAIAIRVNPVAAAQGGAMRMGGKPSPFGFDEETLPEVVEAVAARRHLQLAGVHIFSGTQILDAAVLLAQWNHGLDIAKRVAAHARHALASIDLGGGLGIPYYDGDAALDLTALAQGIAALRRRQQASPAIRSARIVVEPGRFLVGEAGLYVMAVNAVKRSRGSTFVITDGGMHHHLAASGNLGQVIKRDYPLLAPARLADSPHAAPVSVVGPLCTPLDTLARRASLPPLAAGDLVAVLQSGAYGPSASPAAFLSHPPPTEVLIDNGTTRQLTP